MTTILTKIFSFGLSIFVFFSGLLSSWGCGQQISDIPDGATRIMYGTDETQKMDVFCPADTTGTVNILFAVHGGAWLMGDGSEFNDNCKKAAEECGYIAVTADYRKISDGATAYDMVDDIGNAIAKLKETLENSGITIGKMIITGHSAGAHIALMYAYNHYEDCPIDIAFVVSNCAPTEFLKDAKNSTTTMGKYAHIAMSSLSGVAITSFNTDKQQDVINSISPLSMVTSSVPPTIVVQGDKDTMVPYSNSTDLYEALQNAGVDSVMITYTGADHWLGSQFQEAAAARNSAFFEFAEKYL